MKKFVLVYALLFLVTAGNGAIRYVSNQGGAPYTTVALAISASSPGDTIIVAPSVNPYSGFTVDRRVTIVGAGTDTIPGNATKLSSELNVQSSGNGTILRSLFLQFTSGNLIVINSGTIDILIENCFLQNQHIASGEYHCVKIQSNCSVSFIKCGFWISWPAGGSDRAIDLLSGSIINIQSCVFSYCDYAVAGGDATTTLNIYHTIFDQSSTYQAISTDAYGIVQNSACIGNSIVTSSPNMFFRYCASSGTLPQGEGNIPIVGGEFVNLVSGYPRRSDYHVSANSPLRNAGNPASAPDLDGSRADIGVYGGQFPYNEFGIPDLPRVTVLDVDAAVPQNGILHIGSEGRIGP
jgi:hypothetical protein